MSDDIEFKIRLIPGPAADEIMRLASAPPLGTSIGFDPTRPRPPLTLRQKVRVWRSSARWWVHDKLFPDCDESW